MLRSLLQLLAHFMMIGSFIFNILRSATVAGRAASNSFKYVHLHSQSGSAFAHRLSARIPFGQRWALFANAAVAQVSKVNTNLLGRRPAISEDKIITDLPSFTATLEPSRHKQVEENECLKLDPPLPEGLAYDEYQVEQSNRILEGEEPSRLLTPVLKVTTVEKAKQVVQKLNSLPHLVYACDTEVANIDLSKVGPVGNGMVTCLSIYSGPDVDFGEGPGKAIWVDNLGNGKDEKLLNYFKDWLENDNFKKVWHNYGFDRHVLHNEGINTQGFAGDTMHMARLWDASRDKSIGGGKGYSLESLTQEFYAQRVKRSMKDLFGVPRKLKSGEASKVKEIPDIATLQQHSLFRENFIQYSAFDAEATWLVYNALKNKLEQMEWQGVEKKKLSMLEFYDHYLRPFGELLTFMEREGIKVDKDYLASVQKQAELDQQNCLNQFKEWASKQFEDGKYLNPASSAQIQAFIFGGNNNLPATREFVIDKEPEELQAIADQKPCDEYESMALKELKEACKEKGLKLSGTKQILKTRLRGEELGDPLDLKKMTLDELLSMASARCIDVTGDTKIKKTALIKKISEDQKYYQEFIQENEKKKEKQLLEDKEKAKNASKKRTIVIQGLGVAAKKFTKTGKTPQVDALVLRQLAWEKEEGGKPGLIYDFFRNKLKKSEDEAMEAVQAMNCLCKMGSIDTMISNFLKPLQDLADEHGRVHCSLNLNTETGRLSARKPNLQNQPALEKDSYKIRQAFTCEPGNILVVADYGQLELRLLAHIAGCKSMIDAFEAGGCFHSRTAMGMFNYIKEAVDSGKVLLEWDYTKGEPTAPLLKDVYGSERRKAKTLNFSLAYGKTPYGLAKDWGVDLKEAQEMLEAWYADRPEVKAWQTKTKSGANKTGYTKTLMGRSRNLPGIKERANSPARGHAERAAINTPVQGGAADIVMMCMLKLHNSEKLRHLNYKLLLQIHDEVILEGPEEHKEEALKEVRKCMENPFDEFGLNNLLVKLTVDAKFAKTWYEAK